VKGANTRSCRIYFDNRNVTQYTVLGAEDSIQPKIPDEGVNELKMWSRTWDRRFTVDVHWENGEDSVKGIKGRVGCEWAEYESGTVDIGGAKGKIPAFEEVLSFLPDWATVSKAAEGLVQAWGEFEI